ncbi:MULTISPECIES: hypothetical protein [Actinomyces]|uniref:Uncharacterized protein n=1 Tax=Actinomyces succiniciruminis TaxID=1522002 RepID=A0A1L7RQW5_9ACTO|nr:MULTISPECIES: hypothetical protein [Actinomyces]CED91948.1 Hypothetical protein AAM4_2116 [Actinomyces succiniciruminis]
MATFTIHADGQAWRVDEEFLKDTYDGLDEIQRRGYGVLWFPDADGNETFLYLGRHTPVAITFNSRQMAAAAYADLIRNQEESSND